ncbi:MAG: hypothetical protein KAR18_10175, partial [Spirochaetes bacterium]|nr:hypothetical protein [Spirochaetota bacterium]
MNPTEGSKSGNVIELFGVIANKPMYGRTGMVFLVSGYSCCFQNHCSMAVFQVRYQKIQLF